MSRFLADLAKHPNLLASTSVEGWAVNATPRPSVAAVIVSWRTGPLLFQCLEAAFAAPDIDEVVLVDNGNPRETRVRLLSAAAARKDFRIVWGQGNVGFARGCNLGAEHARSSRLVFLNPDAVVAPGAVARLAEAGEDLPRPWLVGGRVMGPDGVEQRGARRGDITMWSAFVEMTGLTRLGLLHSAFRSVHYENDPLPEAPMEVPTVSGAFLMMRADDFRRLGGFDERYFVHVEDVDLCRRVREDGGQVVFAPHAVVVHEGATSPVSSVRVGWYKGLGFAKYFMKFARRAGGRTAAIIMAPIIIGAAIVHGAVRTYSRKDRHAPS